MLAAAISTSLGFIVLRKLRETHFLVTPTYVNATLMVLASAIVLVDKGVHQFTSYQWLDYLLFACNGLAILIGQSFKAWALHYDSASRIGILQYVESIANFSFDMLIAHTQYSHLQYVALAVIFFTNLINAALNLRSKHN